MIFSKFPRELGFPSRKGRWRIVRNKKEFLEAVNLMNGKRTVFSSIYSFREINEDRPIYETAHTDKLFFDLDGEKSFDNIVKFHYYLKKEDLKHILIFSGGGFHIYIKCKGEVQNKKDALFNAEIDILKKAGMSYGDSKIADIDRAVLGKLDQLARVPNTFNIKRRRFCIYVSKEDLEKGFDFIKEKAKKQNFEIPKAYGTKEVDLTQFDFPSKKALVKSIHSNYKSVISDVKDNFLQLLPPCVQYIFLKKSNNKYRYWVIIFLKNLGFTEEETRTVCKKYWSKFKRNDGTNDYIHADRCHHDFETIFRKNKNHFFPRCETLECEGLCEKKCKWWNKTYYERDKNASAWT